MNPETLFSELCESEYSHYQTLHLTFPVWGRSLAPVFPSPFPAIYFHGFWKVFSGPRGHCSPTGTLFLRALPIKRRRRTMNDEKSISWKKLQEKWLTRRNLIRGAAGTAAGAGLLLGAGLRSSALADDDDEGKRNRCKAPARPIPHISTPPGAHFYFPGPVDASPTTSPNTATTHRSSPTSAG